MLFIGISQLAIKKVYILEEKCGRLRLPKFVVHTSRLHKYYS